MTPQIYAPHPDLASFVKCYWTLEMPATEAPEINTIVPDGCIKMIFHHADPYRHHPVAGDSLLLDRCLIVGQLTKPYRVSPEGKTGTFFVCFHPNGFAPFSKTPIKEIEDTVVPINTVFGEEGQGIGQQVLHASSTRDRIRLMEDFLFARLQQAETVDQIVSSTVETILTAGGQLSVNELSARHATNRRQLARKFSTLIGLSPKQLSRTIRLQSALKTLVNQEKQSLTHLAYDNEFYDQAHFIKDFKAFTGLTPKEFYGDELKMSLVFEGPGVGVHQADIEG